MISTQPPTQISLDFDRLREAGLRHIEKLSSQLWTDYNSHDPGITILEVLCYAITDLGYRTDYDIKDILASYKADPNGDELASSLFPITDILPSQPFTARDYRKLLLDNKAIRNVWFYPVADNVDPTFFLNYIEKTKIDTTTNPVTSVVSYENQLSFDNQPPVSNDPNETILVTSSEIISPFGLYEIQIEFEEDNVLEDLNSNLIKEEKITINFNQSTEKYPIEIAFPYWGDVPEEWRTADFGTETLELGTFIVADRSGFDEYYLDYFFNLTSPNLVAELSPNSVKLRENLRESVAVNGETWNFHVNFLDWHEVTNRLDNIPPPTIVNVAVLSTAWDGDIDVNTNEITWINKNVYIGQVRVTLSDGGTPAVTEDVDIQLKITFEKDLPILESGLDQFLTPIADKINGANSAIINKRKAIDDAVKAKLLETTGTGFTEAPFEIYQKRLNRINEILYDESGVYQKIMANRNLCEDFYQFTATGLEEIAICGEFIFSQEYDADEVMAAVFFHIDQFLSPIIQFKSLQEMLDLGYSLDEIFEGPLLENGFLPDESFETLQRKNTIFTSDLINIIMDVKGVIAVNGFKISNYINNKLYNQNAVNCIKLDSPISHKPKLSIDKSQVTMFTSNVKIEPDFEVINSIFEEKKQALIDYVVDTDYDLPIPVGSDQLTENYASIQEDFPMVYGISAAGLPSTATAKRQGQAKQLKGYLFFFEQVLSSYLSQLTNVKSLFSINEDADKTYHTQPLYDIPGIAPLYKDFVDNYTDWNVFVNDPNNAYISELNNATAATEADRRNRFLDHLAARFAEEFSEYALLMYARTEGATAERLAADKIRFLSEYPSLSKNRGAAFNYKLLDANADPDVWDTDNVSGFEKRLARLLGIENYNRRFLFFVQLNQVDVSGTIYHQFSFFDKDGMVLLISEAIYDPATPAILRAAVDYVWENGGDSGNYLQGSSSPSAFYHYLNDADGNLLVQSPDYPTQQASDDAQLNTALFINERTVEEGFHLIEHLLIRPKNKEVDDGNGGTIEDDFLSVSFDNSTAVTPAQKDPYSFKMSILIPDAPRFKDVIFRNYIERTIRLETPAHIYVEIYWPSDAIGGTFELAYKIWLEENAKVEPDLTELTTAQIALIQAMKLL